MGVAFVIFPGRDWIAPFECVLTAAVATELASMEPAFVTPVGHQMIVLRLSARLLPWITPGTTRVSTFLCCALTIAAVTVVANRECVFVTWISMVLAASCISALSIATLAA